MAPSLFRLAAAFALAAVPVCAAAAPVGNYGIYGSANVDDRAFMRAVLSADLSDGQRAQIRDLRRNNAGYDEARLHESIMAVLTPEQRRHVELELRNGTYNGGGYYGNGTYNGNGGYRGNGGNRNCNNGSWNNGTNGGWNNGGWNNGGWNNGGYGNGPNGPYRQRNRNGGGDGDGDRDDCRGGTNGGYNNGNTFNATISSFNRFDLYTQNGQHVLLHQGTLINPTGTTLRAGMRVTIYGYPAGDGTFHADRIDTRGY